MHQPSRQTRRSFRFFPSLKSGGQTSAATGTRDANRHTLSSRTHVSQGRNPASGTRIMPVQQQLRLLQMPRVALNHLTCLGLANRVSVAKHNPKQAAKLSPKLGKTHPTATLLLMTRAATSVIA